MELFFVTLFAACLCMLARYVVPKHEKFGAIVAPAVGAVLAAALWVSCTWLGFSWNQGWIWFVTLLTSVVLCCLFCVFLARKRAVSDELLFQELSTKR